MNEFNGDTSETYEWVHVKCKVKVAVSKPFFNILILFEIQLVLLKLNCSDSTKKAAKMTARFIQLLHSLIE
jgi:hypothetical protein